MKRLLPLMLFGLLGLAGAAEAVSGPSAPSATSLSLIAARSRSGITAFGATSFADTRLKSRFNKAGGKNTCPK